MANDCFFDMVIVGEKKNCDEWINRMKTYDNPNHFYKMYDIEIMDEDIADVEYDDDDECCVNIHGYCAWSLEDCCRAGGYSKGVDLFAVNTKELDLDMEVYSDLEEHYLYKKGVCEIADARECREYDVRDYDTIEEARKEIPELPDDITQEDFVFAKRAHGDIYKVGGFGDWDFVM